MSDYNIDKTSLSSDSCSIYPNPEAAAAVCTISEPVVDLTLYSATSSAPSSIDTFSQPVSLPSHLSAHDRIRVSDGKGGSLTLELVNLIRESRKNPQALQQLRLLADLAAAQDPAVLNSCYVDREENLLPALAQLASSDLVAQHEGALTLRSFILGHHEDRELQQGLLATVSNIANTDHNSEARKVVVSVYQDRSPQNEGLRYWMQSHTQAPHYVTETELMVQADKETNAAASSFGGSLQALGAFGHGLAEAATPLATGTVFPTLAPTPLGNSVTDQILSLIERRTPGTPLEGLPAEGILAFAQNNAPLPAAPFDSGMRLRILASALSLNGFTGAGFGHSTAVATRLAQEIRIAVHSAAGSEADIPLPNSVRSNTSLPAGEDMDGVSRPGISVPAIAPSADSVVAQSWDGRSAAGTADNFFAAPLLTSLSGMQALAYQSSAFGPSPLATQAMGFGHPSSYHIEGPTTLDEDGHQGFGGHSQGQGSGQQDGRSHDQQPGQPDAYFA